MKNTGNTRMEEIQADFALPPCQFARKVIGSDDFSYKLAVWSFLRDRLTGDTQSSGFQIGDMYYFPYFMALLNPVISCYREKLPPSDREDFDQEIAIGLLRRLPDYQPCMNGGQYLGNVFFSNVIRGIYQNFRRKLKHVYPPVAISGACDTNTPELSYRFLSGSDPGDTPCDWASSAEDIVLRKIEGDEIKQRYLSMLGNYSSSDYVIRKILKEFLDT